MIKTLTRTTATVILFILILFGITKSTVQAFDLPAEFENVQVINNLNDPDGFDFSPDGRMFISERITGRLLVAKYDNQSDQWTLNSDPFYTFDIPKDENGMPEAVRSAGLRDITFDPDFETNGYIYAFYMKDDLLHNRVVRLKADPNNPDVADVTFGEQLLIELPFNNTFSSGSHNGGALEFGNDNKLYITTGDGWTGEFAGDPVQSLSTFTGKIFRLNPDGSIPTDNPFYNQTSGDYRAIYALGLRNPYSMSRHPDTGLLYINEARGNKKADIYIVEAGANYKHQGSSLGTPRNPWANAAQSGGELITGGAWYPQNGPFPDSYYGVYFTALWGSNTSATGRINYIKSNSDTSTSTFETNVGLVGANGLSVKPVITRIGPDGNLYYMLTTYTTASGTIQMVRYTGQQTVATPIITPAGATSETPVTVSLQTSTPDAQIYYTLDGSTPTTASTLYTAPFSIDATTVLQARAFKTGFNSSSTASALFTIGQAPDNLPPVVDAGPDLITAVGQATPLDGSASYDPDGDDNFLTDEQWTQLSGPQATINDPTEEVAFFTPTRAGTYRFQLSMSDTQDFGSDEVTVTVFNQPRATPLPLALYTFYAGEGDLVHDVSGSNPALDLTIQNLTAVQWNSNSTLTLNSPTTLNSVQAAATINNACQSSNEATIEAWITPANLSQDGPARIVSISNDPFTRNITLGQQEDAYDGRIRTTTTNNNGEPSLSTGTNSLTDTLTHVAFVRDSSGSARFYVDGVVEAESTVAGNLSNWASDYQLILGNEQTNDRPWLGEFSLVAVYCTALSANDIETNIDAGLPYSDGTVISTPTPTPEATSTPEPEETPTTDRNEIYLPLILKTEATASEESAEIIFAEDFGSDTPLSNAGQWFDTAANNSMVQDDILFAWSTFDNEAVFGTSSSLSNIHSHYLGLDSDIWSGYRFTGRMLITESNSGVGVTFFSDYPNSDTYYRLRRFDGNTFEIAPHGTTVVGETVTGVRPIPNQWYRFKIEVDDVGTKTEIRAKVWEDSESEPVTWQVQVYDDSPTRRTTGAIGVWSLRSGSKYWDDFVVASFNQRKLTTDTVGEGAIQVEPNQVIFDQDQIVSLTATTDPQKNITASAQSWEFSGWNGAISGVTNPTTLVMETNKTVTATFELTSTTPETYTLTTTTIGSGTISTTPDKASYNQGEVVELTASPAPQWTFLGWSGNLTTSNSTASLTMDANKTVAATFTETQSLYTENFEAYNLADDPADWYDTNPDNSMEFNESLFSVFDLNGEQVFGTTQSAINFHSHYTGLNSDTWTNYRFTGRMLMTASNSGLGVTLFSDYPNSDTYYRLRRYGDNNFHISPHGTQVSGDIYTGVVPVPNQWYLFKVEVEDTGSQTEIRAKVWADGDGEPTTWQATAYDDTPSRRTSGKIGIWSNTGGSKYWDDFVVTQLD